MTEWNENRVARGSFAVDAHLKSYSDMNMHDIESDGDKEAAFVDCLADILHYAKREGFSPAQMMGMALNHFRAEAGE